MTERTYVLFFQLDCDMDALNWTGFEANSDDEARRKAYEIVRLHDDPPVLSATVAKIEDTFQIDTEEAYSGEDTPPEYDASEEEG